jgi:hypothetical protein
MDFHNIRQLKESSENGCHMCTLMLLCITAEEQRRYLEELERASEGEPQFVAVVWFFAFPPPNPLTTPILRLEEAYPRPPVCNRVIICELNCEVLTDARRLSMFTIPYYTPLLLYLHIGNQRGFFSECSHPQVLLKLSTTYITG